MSTVKAHAYIKGIKSLPRKTGIVASLVRDRYVADALVILDHTPRRAALPIKKAIESAKANLMQHYSVDTKTKKAPKATTEKKVEKKTEEKTEEKEKK